MKIQQISVAQNMARSMSTEINTTPKTTSDTATVSPWVAFACIAFFPAVYVAGKWVLAWIA
ncbi:MAG: hypothetical protein R2795_27305 [Saprospiraceae bacterium]